MSASNTDNRTATQRIEDLEKVVTMLYQATSKLLATVETGVPQLQQDMLLVKDALKLINKKTEAVIQLAKPETGIDATGVSNFIVNLNVSELTSQVAEWLKNGSLVGAEEAGDNSFLVCQESTADGTVVNPRIQFRIDSIDAATKEAFKGKKVGDTVSFGQDKFDAKILEIYTIAEPKAPEAEAPVVLAEGVPAPEAAEAPAAQAEAAPAPELSAPPAESPVGFGLEFHGQPEATLTAPADSQTA